MSGAVLGRGLLARRERLQFELEVLFLVIKRPRLPRLHEIVRTVEPVCLRMLRLKIELCAVNVCKLQRRAKAFLLGQECLQQRFLLAQGFEQARKLEQIESPHSARHHRRTDFVKRVSVVRLDSGYLEKCPGFGEQPLAFIDEVLATAITRLFFKVELEETLPLVILRMVGRVTELPEHEPDLFNIGRFVGQRAGDRDALPKQV